jgi:hypothetical protein
MRKSRDGWHTWCGATLRNDPDWDDHLLACPVCALRAKRAREHGYGLLSVEDAANDPVWDKCVERPDGCWTWKGCINPRRRLRLKRGGRIWRVHRWIFALVHGGIPDKVFICHSCPHAWCVNPAHLFAGDLPTMAGHISDRVKEGIITWYEGLEPGGVFGRVARVVHN